MTDRHIKASPPLVFDTETARAAICARIELDKSKIATLDEAMGNLDKMRASHCHHLPGYVIPVNTDRVVLVMQCGSAFAVTREECNAAELEEWFA